MRWIWACDQEVEWVDIEYPVLYGQNKIYVETLRHPDRFATRLRMVAKRSGRIHHGIVKAWIDIDDIDLMHHSSKTWAVIYLFDRVEAKYSCNQVMTLWGLPYGKEIQRP